MRITKKKTCIHTQIMDAVVVGIVGVGVVGTVGERRVACWDWTGQEVGGGECALSVIDGASCCCHL